MTHALTPRQHEILDALRAGRSIWGAYHVSTRTMDPGDFPVSGAAYVHNGRFVRADGRTLRGLVTRGLVGIFYERRSKMALDHREPRPRVRYVLTEAPCG